MKSIVYIDGTNLLVEMGKAVGIPFRADKMPTPALSLAFQFVAKALEFVRMPVQRKYWFGSYAGNEADDLKHRQALRSMGYEPILFRKNQGREKGVDISLTKEMLVHAFHRNCSCSVLFAGDEDYLSLIQEVKRYDQRVLGYFFQDSTSEELRLAFDEFRDLWHYSAYREMKLHIDEFRTKMA